MSDHDQAHDGGLDPELIQRAKRLSAMLEEVERLDRVSQKVLSDPLTGLSTMTLFMDRLRLTVARLERHGGFAAVVFADVDRFQAIRDTHGREAAERILAEVGARLGAAIRETDVVARFGEDEFVVCGEVSQPDEARRVAERVEGAFALPFEVDGRLISVSASLGIAVAGRGTAAEDLLAIADQMMYEARSSGGGRTEYAPVRPPVLELP